MAAAMDAVATTVLPAPPWRVFSMWGTTATVVFVWQMHGDGGARSFRYLLEEVVAVDGLNPRLTIETEEGSVIW